MNKILRKPVIAGNWKMNKTPEEAKVLLEELIPLVKNASCEVVCCVPFVDLHIALKTVNGTEIKIGAQNCHYETSGAFTGEISVEMLKAINVEYVIIGHSERRMYFAQTDEIVNKQLKTVINRGLKAILCVGEHLEQREQGITEDLIAMQIKIALNGIPKEKLENVIIAYEPVWAIGTGKTATAKQANEVCKHIRGIIASLYGDEASNKIIIQYGGSMNAKNADELLAEEHIDGGLIGGASLKPVDFAAIVKATSK